MIKSKIIRLLLGFFLITSCNSNKITDKLTGEFTLLTENVGSFTTSIYDFSKLSKSIVGNGYKSYKVDSLFGHVIKKDKNLCVVRINAQYIIEYKKHKTSKMYDILPYIENNSMDEKKSPVISTRIIFPSKVDSLMSCHVDTFLLKFDYKLTKNGKKALEDISINIRKDYKTKINFENINEGDTLIFEKFR